MKVRRTVNVCVCVYVCVCVWLGRVCRGGREGTAGEGESMAHVISSQSSLTTRLLRKRIIFDSLLSLFSCLLVVQLVN